MIFSSCTKKNYLGSEKEKDEQEDILTKAGIDSVLDGFDEVNYSELDEQYLNYSNPDRKFEKELSPRSFYVIPGDKVNTKVIGNFRVRDFLAHDDYYKFNKKYHASNITQFWLIDKEVLYMMLDLIHQLDELDHNKYGFHIRNSHRHPKLNTDSNGAKYSQHMFGRAIDIGIDDIDNDGKAMQKDKTIVYEILQDIVGNKGGLGKYPGSMNLHFDCRGFKARWDFP